MIRSTTQTDAPDVLCFATQGSGSGDQERIAQLLGPLRPRFLEVDRRRKLALPMAVLRTVRRRRPDIIVMEGTGVAGGVGVMLARTLQGVPYVVSSGDAVGPFLRASHPAVGPVPGLYERMLCRLCAGFIGWSPYLVGRALTLGAPRAVTAASSGRTPAAGARSRVRRRLGIPEDAIVIGIAGSVNLNERIAYSYGVDLVRALHLTSRVDLRVMVVGDGSGLENLAALAGEELGRRVLLPGHCSASEVPDYLAAMDIGALSQSTDLVGAMRYTTKLPEYLAAGLPVVATEIPVAYDLDTGWVWRLPGDAPWDELHVESLAHFMQTVTPEDIAQKAAAVPQRRPDFDPLRLQERVCAFVRDVYARPDLRYDSAHSPAPKRPDPQ